jgi:bifunctional non-homologous end joining protein LigD
MRLREYQRKRDFSRTPEPRGSALRKTKGNSYLVQKHAARRLHYDLRLELDGVLISWAVPKGPSLDPKERRLAVHVEDHPLEYAGFEGSIPKGEYGAGTVLLWDRGTWEPEGEPHEGLRRGELKFRLYGEKLRGSWVLVRMGKPASDPDAKDHWLLIKHPDEESAPLAERDILQERPESVATGRSMEEIASGKEAGQARDGAPDPGGLPGACKSPMPEKVSLQLATLAGQVPEGDHWLHEIKFDGYRALCRIEMGEASFYTREGINWTDRFGKLPEAAAALGAQSALLDGEVVVVLADGTTSFEALQNALGRGDHRLVYYAFDLLYLDGFDLRKVPLLRRKELLSSLLQNEKGPIRFSDHYQGAGEDLFHRACGYGLEGIISKRADRPHVSGRTRDWLKIKCRHSQEFVIGGFTDPAGSRPSFGALLVGVYENSTLVYCGRVGTGYSDRALKELGSQLRKLEQPGSPFSNPPAGPAGRNVHWARPELVAQVEFTGWTRGGILRHPSFAGLRQDKKPCEVRGEKADGLQGGAEASGSDRGNETVAGVKISNPRRLLYVQAGITKLELARYYEAVAEWALPHIQNRPLMVLRCPEGVDKECFYQKHPPDPVPAAIKRISIPEQESDGPGFAIDSLPGLITLAQMGALEIHARGCRMDRLEQPDLMVFDFDPDLAVPWQQVMDAAHETRSLLQELGLVSFVKTTGGKGLHVVVPLTPAADWDQVKEFSKGISEALEQLFPDRYVANMSKARRKGRIFVDYLRNGRGATAICPYSTRARPGAPVSAPIHWDELTPDLRPDQFTTRSLPRRMMGLKRDPWEGMDRTRQSITAAMHKKLGK